MMRASPRARSVFAVLSPIFLLLCVAALRGEDNREWSGYQEEFARLFAAKASAKLEEAEAKGDAQEVAHWTRIVGEVSQWKPDIKQIYLEDLKVADRCTTCHLGIDNPLFADAPQPFQTHPGTLLEAHEVDGIGCTVCHDGQGSATTVDAAHGHEPNWPQAMLPATMTQSTCSRCHQVTHGLAGAERASQGAELFLTKGCYGCHDVADISYLPKFSPPLNDLKSKLQDPQAWIEAWIRQPSHLAADTLMPNFLLSDREVGKITAFLLALGTPGPSAPIVLDPASVEVGKTLFTERGCRGCHGVEAGEHSASPRVPHLGTVGSKVTAEWMDRWIADPKEVNPDTAMPKVALEEAERRAIVAYLMTLKRTEPLPKPMDLAGLDPAEGKELVKHYECFGCHAIEGFETVRPSVPNLGEFARRAVDELDFGSVPGLPRTKWDWLRHKLDEPRAYESADIKLKMPVTPLSDQEADALIAFVIGLDPLPLPARYVVPASPAAQAARNASWMVARLHCNGCHRWNDQEAHIAAFFERKSRVGPILDGVGARLQGQFLVDFLMEPKATRPWLTLRMPTFGFSQDDAQSLVAGLAGLAGTVNPYTYVAKLNIDAERFERGFRRFHHYKCIQCHPSSTDQGLPEGLNPDDLSINLMLAKDRLRPEWFADFMARPKQLAGTDTRMPTVFYTVDGVPKVEHPQQDIDDIVAYVMGMKEDAEITIQAYQQEIQAEEKKDEIDWSSVEY